MSPVTKNNYINSSTRNNSKLGQFMLHVFAGVLTAGAMGEGWIYKSRDRMFKALCGNIEIFELFEY